MPGIGNIGVAKTYLGEITDKTNQGKGFSAFGLTYGLGVIVGPLIGGLLAKPAAKYPSVFPPGSFFDQFPYLLPPLVSASVTLFGLVFGFFFLPETKISRQENVEMHELKEETMDENEEQQLVKAQDTNENVDQPTVKEQDTTENEEQQQSVTITTELIPEHVSIESNTASDHGQRCKGFCNKYVLRCINESEYACVVSCFDKSEHQLRGNFYHLVVL